MYDPLSETNPTNTEENTLVETGTDRNNDQPQQRNRSNDRVRSYRGGSSSRAAGMNLRDWKGQTSKIGCTLGIRNEYLVNKVPFEVFKEKFEACVLHAHKETVFS